jgi:endoglucanase
MKETIRQLVEAWGPSGYEYQIREMILEMVRGLIDEYRVDTMGNLICRVGSGGLKVMIATHMDEIGVMVNYVGDKGFLRFDSIGRLLLTSLHGSRVKFSNGMLGIIGLENPWKRTEVPRIEEFFIDVGSIGDHNVGVGDPATMWSRFCDRDTWLVGKSMDNRINCAIAIEVIRQLRSTPHELYWVFTVQEEVGMRGAGPVSFGVQPDLGIALDVINSGDEPKVQNVNIRLGDGPAIKVRDRYQLVPRPLVELMLRRAKEANIKYQLEARDLGGTDGAAIQASRTGIPAGSICIPTRYLHTSSEVVDYRDVLGVTELLKAFLVQPIEW